MNKTFYIIDDHDLLRRGTISYLEASSDWKSAGDAKDGEKALLVTPDFYAQLIGKNWIPASEIAADVRIRGAVGMAYGCQVIVSNRLITGGSLYIVKPGTLAVIMKRNSMVETDRDILNQSTVLAGSIMCAPYLLNPTGMVKLSVGE